MADTAGWWWLWVPAAAPEFVGRAAVCDAWLMHATGPLLPSPHAHFGGGFWWPAKSECVRVALVACGVDAWRGLQ